ncbi:MAG: TOMM precursor leader peptide-binding protein [Labilithrix sp.]|nr:TOMM precursor leader peptide-binding protein [Labilithrix sp.]
MRLRPGVAVIPMGRAVQLRIGDEQIHVLESDPPEAALEALQRLERGEPVDDASDLVAELDARGLLVRDARDADAPAERARLSVRGHAPSVRLLESIAGEHGVTIDEGGALVCVVEAPDLALLFEINDLACGASRACLFVDLSHGSHATIGPFHLPGEGACYRCFRRRLHETTAAYDELVAAERRMLETRAPLPGVAVAAAHRHFALGIAAAELDAFFTRRRPLRTLSRALTVDLDGAAIWSEPVLRVPWCSTC